MTPGEEALIDVESSDQTRIVWTLDSIAINEDLDSNIPEYYDSMQWSNYLRRTN